MKWDNYSDQAVAIQRNWIFVILLWWIMYAPLSWLLSITAHHGSFISLFTPPTAHRGFNKDFGKKALSAVPSTPGGSSKVVPIASLNPYQSKWVCFPVSGECHVKRLYICHVWDSNNTSLHAFVIKTTKLTKKMQQKLTKHQQHHVKCCMLDIKDNGE